ncbi:hypothetical protein [[Phormidium] sp. ETS-05]|uniref:hypothetical protein n=1 Tax=[Phormidium] sp. ETS-05 TaxID=222819 RepID=UPI0018EED065|nr:hypothetical protein [[Phormidium] sp. ETS-05]
MLLITQHLKDDHPLDLTLVPGVGVRSVGTIDKLPLPLVLSVISGFWKQPLVVYYKPIPYKTHPLAANQTAADDRQTVIFNLFSMASASQLWLYTLCGQRQKNNL